MIRKICSSIVTLIISVILLCGGTTIAFATYIPHDSPQYDYTYSCNSYLTTTGSTANCSSDIIGYKNKTTKIVIYQTLQKQTASYLWNDVSNASWTTTVNNYYASVANTKSSLSNGTYRLKTVFKVYSGSSYETITVYSLSSTI